MPLERDKREEIHSVLDRLAKIDTDSNVDSKDEKDAERVLSTVQKPAGVKRMRAFPISELSDQHRRKL